MFVMVLFWFQLYNGFSGSNAINDLNLIFFNLIFTALPPIISGIWDQDVSCETLLKKPYLYKQGQESEVLQGTYSCWNKHELAMLQNLYMQNTAFDLTIRVRLLLYIGCNQSNHVLRS